MRFVTDKSAKLYASSKISKQSAIMFLVVSLFLAFIDPYNAAGDIPFILAFIYWLTMVVCGGVIANAVMQTYGKYRPDWPVWGMLASGATSSALGVTAYIITVETVLREAVSLSYWPKLYGLVLVISVAISAIGYLADRAFATDAQTRPADDTGTVPAKFLSRLPARFQKATLFAISAEDHYLRVHTSLGETLILMRLGDAVRELSDGVGLRVHRSWWVATPAVASSKRKGARAILILKNGTEIPVSRSYQAAAKAAGLFTNKTG